jgi:hypothetical protein
LDESKDGVAGDDCPQSLRGVRKLQCVRPQQQNHKTEGNEREVESYVHSEQPPFLAA